MSEWQPIKDVPEGVPVLMTRRDWREEHEMGWLLDGKLRALHGDPFSYDGGDEPTHFMKIERVY